MNLVGLRQNATLHWTILLVMLLASSGCQLIPPSAPAQETIASPTAQQAQSAVHTPTSIPA